MPVPYYELIGVAGVFQILIAFVMLQFERLTTQNITYQLLNALGASCILFSLFFHFNFSAFLMELCWLAVSIY